MDIHPQRQTTQRRKGINYDLWLMLEKVRQYLGVDKRTWARILQMTDQKYRALPRARKSVSVFHLTVLARELGVSVDSIVTGEVSMEQLRRYKMTSLTKWLPRKGRLDRVQKNNEGSSSDTPEESTPNPPSPSRDAVA